MIMPRSVTRHVRARLAPSAVIRAAKIGKARGDHGGVVDRAPACSAARPMHQEAHGDAVIEMRRDHAAARDLARRRRARSDRRPRSRVVTPAASRPAATAARRSDLLHAQFVQAAHARLAAGERGRDREHGIFVDHRGRALGRHVDALERAVHARADRRRPRRPRCASSSVSMSPPISTQRGDQADAQRVHHHALDHDVGARHDQRRDDREGGGRRIGRHDDSRAVEVRPAFERDAPPVRPVRRRW